MDFLDAYGSATPEKAALIQDTQTVTYADLAARSNSFARALLVLGLQQGNKAVWCSPNDQMIVTFSHAARKLGVFSVPLNYRFTQREMKHVIENCGAKLVIVNPKYEEKIKSLELSSSPKIISFSDAEKLIASHDSSPLDFEPPSLGASMIYTSGTTGSPKGAVRSGTDPMVVAQLIGEFELTPDDIHLATGPLYHSGPSAFTGISALLGTTIVIMEHFDPAQWIETVNKHSVTTTFAAPTQLQMILDTATPQDSIPTMRFLIVSAAPFPYALKKRWIEKFGNNHLWELYGSTELGIDTLLKPSDQLAKPGSCGKPAPGVQLKILKEDGSEAAPGEPGDLWMNSSSAFDGYHEDPEKNAETTLRDDPAWRSVGDIAYVDDDGFFYICDRKIDMIITGGMNVYPAEVEAALYEHPGVADVGVIGIDSAQWGEEVVAFVCARDGAKLEESDLTQHCRDRIAGYKIPKTFVFRDELPRTESGKLLKRKLRDSAPTQ